VSGVRVPQDVFFQEVEDEVVFLNLQTSMYHGLDKVGSRAWGLLCHHGNVEEAVQSLLQEYDVSEEVLRRDMAVLVQELCTAGLLEVTEPRADTGRASMSL
jgi:hypothetical protein